MIPIKLVLNNFLSHDKSEIDFTKFKSALLIGTYDGEPEQSNGTGKSSVFKGIAFSLFEKTDHKKKDGVVKKDKKSCRVEFTFSVNDQVYRITRKRDKVIGESGVILEQQEGSAFKDISCDTNTATNNKIESIIGLNYDVFINSVYFKQNDVSIFAEATPSKRKDIIKSLLKIEKWDEYQKSAKEKAKELLVRIEEKKKQIVPLNELETILAHSNRRLEVISADLNESKNKLTKVNQNLLEKRNSLFSSGDKKGTADKIKEITKEICQDQKTIANNNQVIKNNEATLGKYIELEKQLKANSKGLFDKIKDGKEINIAKINSSLVIGRTKERVLKEQVGALEKELILDSHCPTCEKPISKDEANKIKVHRQEILNETKVQYEAIKTKLQIAEKKASELQKKAEAAGKAEVERGKVELKLSKCQNAIQNLKGETDLLKEEIKNITNKQSEKRLAELKDRARKGSTERLELEVAELEAELASIQQNADKLNVEYGGLVKTVDDLTSSVAFQKEIQEEVDKLNNEYVVFDKLREYFGKDGIQSIIIENIIDELETYTNDTLSKICNEPTTITIRTQRQTDSGSWMETFDIEVSSGGRTDEFETFSGGEKFRVSLALRLALSKILSKRMGGVVKFLLLDEVSSSLDNKGIDMFVNVIKQLENEMKILIITHEGRLKDRFDDVIIINKTAEGSRIVSSIY